jgi:1-deoxy-D-xylulose-5-phosphate reductoisomerase
MKKRVAILGATGSIGTNTLDVIRHDRDNFEAVLLTAHRNGAALERLAVEFPHARCITTDISRAVAESGADIVVNGIAGAAGLDPSLAAVGAGIDLALANKETMVIAGTLVCDCAARTGSRILPVDSEHSALFHLLQAHSAGTVDELLLTASGGPFCGYSPEQLEAVTIHDALSHPTWKMGASITINSATMANKGLEVIEAARLFFLPAQKITVVIHRQSIVHSMVRFVDGAVYAQMSVPDMRHPIQSALYYPESAPSPVINRLSFDNLTLNFEKPDTITFPLLALAYQAERSGPLYPVAYNAANEVAVESFLAGQIRFTDIANIVKSVLEKDWQLTGTLDRDTIWDVDNRARTAVSACNPLPLDTPSRW